MCTKSQKDGQNHKNTGVLTIFHKRPSLDGRLGNTAFLVLLDMDKSKTNAMILIEDEVGISISLLVITIITIDREDCDKKRY